MKKKLLALVLCMTACISLFGCGGKENADNIPEFVYVPTYQALELGEDVGLWNSDIIGTNLYFANYEYDEATGVGMQKYYKMDLLSQEPMVELDIKASKEGEEFSTNAYMFDTEDNMYVTGYSYPLTEEGVNYDITPVLELRKVSKDNGIEFSQEISKYMSSDDGWAYVQYIEMDQAGNVYLGQEKDVHIFDKECAYVGSVEVANEWMNGLYAIGDKVYAARYNVDYSGMELCEVNPTTKQVGTVLAGIPSNGNFIICEGEENELLISTDTSLLSYDLNTQEATAVFQWIDCDVPGYSVSNIMYLEDGKYMAILSDYMSGTESYEKVFLTKTKSSEVTIKETVTLASLYGYNSDLQKKIVDFNKTNPDYRVTLKTYIDDNAEWTDTTYSDAITRLNNDITSGNCPDIIDMSSLNMDSLVAKGLLEDWTPYLEKSTVISKDDFNEGVLNAYMKDGKLYTLPTSVYICGFMGKEDILSAFDTWTVQDMMTLALANPDCSLLSYASKDSVLMTFLYSASDMYIDYETGKCNFNGEEFLSLLEFANRFPKEYNYDENDSFPKQLREGRCLLADVSFYSMEEYQMYQLLFDAPVKVVGFPSEEGDGHMQLRGESTYGICSKSKHKDGAFAFLETLLDYEEYTRYGYVSGFPTRNDMLDEMFALAMEPEYALDEDGNPVLDENGEPIKYPKTTWGWDDFEAEIYEATPEQVEHVRSLLNNCDVMSNTDEELIKIVSEEVKPYFEGQKTAKEVADVIQSRVSIYVSENM